ncbi:MAG: DUF4153 domain-containing protein [Bacteroidota bacterium]|nr:DUF4153 domain-containing protein [Bacteroidota bacterium]
MKKLSLETWINKLKLVLVRFPFALLFIIGLSVLCFLSIQKVKVEIRESLWAFFILGTLLNIAVALYMEEFKSMKSRILFHVLFSVLLAVYCFTLPEKLFEYQYYQLIALGIVLVLSAFFISFLNRNNEIQFWNFSRNSLIELFISFVFSAVLYAGLSLAILSLDKLFNIHIEREVYSNLAVVCFVIFAPVYFLSNIPDEVEKRKRDILSDKIIKIFGLYILLPILAAYTLILYVYLFRIILKWELPNGWVSMLVSVLGMAGFLCTIILYPFRSSNENKVVDILSRYFPVLLFPLLVLMSIGIFRRIGDYGLTINRYYVLILNIWLFLISFYLFVSQSKHIKWIVISFTIVAFLCSVGPWSVYNLTRHAITNQLEKQLNEAHLLNKGKIITGRDKMQQVDSITQTKVVENIRYLVRTFGNASVQKYFAVPLKEKSEFEILTLIKMERIPVAVEYFWLTLENQFLDIDLHPYKSFILLKMKTNDKLVYTDKKVNVEFLNDCLLVKNKLQNNLVYTIPLKGEVKSLIKESLKMKKNNFPKELMTIKGDNFILIIRAISGNYDFQQDKLNMTTFESYLFY